MADSHKTEDPKDSKKDESKDKKEGLSNTQQNLFEAFVDNVLPGAVEAGLNLFSDDQYKRLIKSKFGMWQIILQVLGLILRQVLRFGPMTEGFITNVIRAIITGMKERNQALDITEHVEEDKAKDDEFLELLKIFIKVADDDPKDYFDGFLQILNSFDEEKQRKIIAMMSKLSEEEVKKFINGTIESRIEMFSEIFDKFAKDESAHTGDGAHAESTTGETFEEKVRAGVKLLKEYISKMAAGAKKAANSFDSHFGPESKYTQDSNKEYDLSKQSFEDSRKRFQDIKGRKLWRLYLPKKIKEKK